MDYLLTHPGIAPERPEVGIAPKLSDAELITLAVMQALLGFTSEARWLRHAHVHLVPPHPSKPGPLRHAYERFRRHLRQPLEDAIRALRLNELPWLKPGLELGRRGLTWEQGFSLGGGDQQRRPALVTPRGGERHVHLHVAFEPPHELD